MNLQRFINAQHRNNTYNQALCELSTGRKITHWIWFIFPQLKGLGYSENAIYYGLDGINEAMAYINNPILHKRLVEAIKLVIPHKNDLLTLFGSQIDVIKFLSSMETFHGVANTDELKTLTSIFFPFKKSP